MSIHLERPNCGSSLCAIELQPQINTIHSSSILTNSNESARQHIVCTDDELLQEPSSLSAENTVEQLQRWNHPRSNIPRTFTTFLSFAIMGATDAAYGVRLYAQMLPFHWSIIPNIDSLILRL